MTHYDYIWKIINTGRVEKETLQGRVQELVKRYTRGYIIFHWNRIARRVINY